MKNKQGKLTLAKLAELMGTSRQYVWALMAQHGVVGYGKSEVAKVVIGLVDRRLHTAEAAERVINYVVDHNPEEQVDRAELAAALDLPQARVWPATNGECFEKALAQKTEALERAERLKGVVEFLIGEGTTYTPEPTSRGFRLVSKK